MFKIVRHPKGNPKSNTLFFLFYTSLSSSRKTHTLWAPTTASKNALSSIPPGTSTPFTTPSLALFASSSSSLGTPTTSIHPSFTQSTPLIMPWKTYMHSFSAILSFSSLSRHLSTTVLARSTTKSFCFGIKAYPNVPSSAHRTAKCASSPPRRSRMVGLIASCWYLRKWSRAGVCGRTKRTRLRV
ncbi:hypothetical protein BC938DRAFT_474509 [Jimgerdemannia flammicorona]|uniref:Uncharacterized protein n=1 Tax=Jimgerdemannia flammicorona TaxID=994334 RepID=A0A433QSG6_9FUNG|nr:hypothetical protein BC938DRAFT_474509 [Jimgerdemannia flammicorona]